MSTASWWNLRDRCSPALAELLRLAGRQRLGVAAYLSFLLGAGALTSLKFILLGWLLQAGRLADAQAMTWLLAAMVGAWLASQFAEYLSNLVGLQFERAVGVQVVRAKVEELFDRASTCVQHLDANHVVHLLRNGLVVVAKTLRAALNAINRLVLVSVTIGTAFYLQPWLATLCLLVAVLMLGWTSRLIRRQRLGTTAALHAQRDLHSRLCRLFSALPQIKLYGAGDEQLRRVSLPIQRQVSGEQVALHAQRWATLEMNVVASVTGLAMVVLGALLLNRSGATIYDLTTLLVLHQAIFNGLRQVLGHWAHAEENSEYITDLLSRPAAEEKAGDKGRRLAGVIERLECEEATFAIGELVLLRDVTCTLQRGRLYGIVGASGSGKTMLLHLLSGHSRPQSGKLAVNGQPLEALDSSDLRSRTALATWPPLLLKGTLEENLRVAKLDATAEEIAEVLRLAALDKDVAQLQPAGGLQAHVGRGGVQLSVGQLQRLALARAFLRRPEVLLLDDLLTGLDPETGDHVLDSLRALATHCLVVFVVPHERALPFCDELLLTQSGRLVAQTSLSAAGADPKLADVLQFRRVAA